MGKIDEKFIDNLNNFSKALENIVELLKEQMKVNPTDVVNQIAENLDAEKIAMIVENLEEIKTKTVYISDNTDKILKEVQAAKNAKETGMFGKVSNKENKNQIIDGVKVIGLIAVGVLAIGTAFKIIGNVDFLSALALSASITLLAYTFERISKIEKLTPKMAGTVALVILAMSAGILGAGYILENMPTLTLPQILSIGAVALVLGFTMFAFGFVFDNLNMKEMLTMSLFLPLILPAISLGVVASSLILQYAKNIEDPWQLVLTSLAIGAATLAITPTMYVLSKVGSSNILSGVLGVILVAGAIAASSYIMSLGDYTNPPDIMWAISVGATMLAMMIPVVAFGLIATTGIGLVAIGLGLLAIIATAGAILAVDYLLAKGSYTTAPGMGWVLSVGFAMGAFGAGMAFMGPLLPLIVLGAGSIYVISKAMVTASETLQSGIWNAGYPSFSWSSGVGTALLAFATAFALVSAVEGIGQILSIFGGGGFDFPSFVKTAAEAMKTASLTLNGGIWDGGYPSFSWALGVGNSLAMFATAFAVVSGIEGVFSFFGKKIDFNDFVKKAAESMVTASNSLAGGNWSDGKFPSKDWADGVGGALAMFATAFAKISMIDGLSGIMNKLFNTEKGFNFNDFVISSVSSMSLASIMLNMFDWTNAKFPKKEWVDGVGGTLIMFADTLTKFKDLDLDIDADDLEDDDGVVAVMLGIVDGIIKVAKRLSEAKLDWTGYPAQTWIDGVSNAMTALSSNEMTSGLDKFLNVLEEIQNVSTTGIDKVTDSIIRLSSELRNLQGTENLLKLSGAFLTISVVDTDKLAKVYDTLSAKQKELKETFDDQSSFVSQNLLNNANTRGTTGIENVKKSEINKTDNDNMYKLIEYVSNIDGNIQKMADKSDVKPMIETGEAEVFNAKRRVAEGIYT